MMNHHMPAGPGQPLPPALPLRPQSSRQQNYHAYHHPPPQSPIHPHQYPNYHPAPYYSHPPQPLYPPPQWRPYQQHPQYMPPTPPQTQQMPPPYHQPRSPMVVTSQPQQPQLQQQQQHAHRMTPVTRHRPMLPPLPSIYPPSDPMKAVPSPRPMSVLSQHPHAVASPSPAPTIRHETPLKQEEQYTSAVMQEPPLSRRQSQARDPLALAPEHHKPFYPELPWYSTSEGATTFPSRATPRRKTRRHRPHQPDEAVALPTREIVDEDVQVQTSEEPQSDVSTIAAPSEPETPATSQAPSESDFTQVSTPATPAQPPPESPKATPTQTHARRDTRTAIAVPHIPGLPKKTSPPAAEKVVVSPHVQSTEEGISVSDGQELATGPEQTTSQEAQVPATPLPKAPPKSWADLVRTKAIAAPAATPANGGVVTNGAQLSKSASLADALTQYSVNSGAGLSFLEPRGLVNTGNMCYMNSILQVLVFCSPFYIFLDQVRQRTVHSMKGNTPLVDAMIMFMREFKVLVSADTVDVLRKMLKQEQLEQYGEPVTPEYVYDAIRKLPRFQTMRRGHQQDAEEFLGFLLEGLHDECVDVMRGQSEEKPKENGASPPDVVMSPISADGWLEVGPKQKASVTRTAGQQDAPSPITKIFGGHLRSELRVPGLKDSVTLEPYKPLQLDIGAQHVNNIVDALKGLTRTEALTGEFGGRGNMAKKQVLIDTLPPVLILHLKRFQYEAAGTQKIWKKVGYPLELEIPKEVFPPSKRGGLAAKGGLPKYRLISVVYHHGKSATGGHYTVDVLRQDSREWVRMDDTVIRRIRPEDVAEGGAEEDPKLLAKALEQHKADQELQRQRNMYQGLDEAEKQPAAELPWSEVNGHATATGKKWSGVSHATNGTTTPASTTGRRTPTVRKEGMRDNKVAYILLYERVRV